MVDHTRHDLPDQGDFRPDDWRDLVGLIVALSGLALILMAFVLVR